MLTVTPVVVLLIFASGFVLGALFIGHLVVKHGALEPALRKQNEHIRRLERDMSEAVDTLNEVTNFAWEVCEEDDERAMLHWILYPEQQTSADCAPEPTESQRR